MEFFGKARFFLLGCLLLSVGAHAQQQTPVKQSASRVFSCLKEGVCGAARMLQQDDYNNMYYQLGIRSGGYTILYIVPVTNPRLEVTIFAEGKELTMIDTDGDGVVDFLIDTNRLKGTVLIVGSEDAPLLTRAQPLFRTTLTTAIEAFHIPPLTTKK